ncbi:MAG: hypothetical protein QOF60_2119 [Actinomycetota bacterium]|jgi:hypothetical protein|nr:hypothetical protein [Actinomycetota bacterium]
MADEVRLVDLEVIKRYSLAVRQETVPADEILVALDASRQAVLAAIKAQPKAKRTRTKAKTAE